MYVTAVVLKVLVLINKLVTAWIGNILGFVVKVTDLWSTSLSREDPESHLKQRTTIL